MATNLTWTISSACVPIALAFRFHCFGNHFRLYKSAWQRKLLKKISLEILTKTKLLHFQRISGVWERRRKSFGALQLQLTAHLVVLDFPKYLSLFGVLYSFCGVCVCWVGSSLEVAITSISWTCFSGSPSTMWIMMCCYLPNNNTTDLKSKGAKKSTSDPKIIMCYQVAATYPTTTQLTSEKIKRSQKIYVRSQNTSIWIAWHSFYL